MGLRCQHINQRLKKCSFTQHRDMLSSHIIQWMSWKKVGSCHTGLISTLATTPPICHMLQYLHIQHSRFLIIQESLAWYTGMVHIDVASFSQITCSHQDGWPVDMLAIGAGTNTCGSIPLSQEGYYEHSYTQWIIITFILIFYIKINKLYNAFEVIMRMLLICKPKKKNTS